MLHTFGRLSSRVGAAVLLVGGIEKYSQRFASGSQFYAVRTFVTKANCASAAMDPKIKSRCDEIAKSPEDKRVYRGLHLQNGLKILLISDPKTDKSAASLDVAVGHLMDPRPLPGLAHFCEHMLFLGTTKYPDENEYHKFLSAHGGGANAYTASDSTNYFFDVAPEHLGGALDRFAQFFLHPLFTETATEREVNAVDSEHSNNVQHDSWRLMQLERTLSDPKHDYSKFGTGNKKTLLEDARAQNMEPRTELLKFHSVNYSSNIMGLCILGRESLDQLTQMAVDLFGDVPDKDVTMKEWKEHPYGPGQLGYRVNIVPVKDLRSLHISFPIPDLHPYRRSRPGSYISHLIGHEGQGSLLSELKRRGWVSSLSSGPRSGSRGFAFFSIDVDLSEDGLEHVDDIMRMVFQYINLIKKDGTHKWIHDECEKLDQLRFRFKDVENPQSYAMTHSTALHYYPFEEALCGPFTMDQYKPELIKMVLDKLTPNNMHMVVVSKSFEGKEGNLKEKWYGTEYSQSKLDQGFLEKCASAETLETLHLPAKNEFIPTKFDIYPMQEVVQAFEIPDPSIPTVNDVKPIIGPKIILDTPMCRLWLKQDDEFLLPKCCVLVQFTTPLAAVDPLSSNLASMYLQCLEDSLTEFTYDADLAGLRYAFSGSKHGISMTISGYDEKIGVLLEKLVDKMVNFKPDEQRFQVLREAYIRALKNFNQEQPYMHATYFTSQLLTDKTWSKTQLLNETDGVTMDSLNAFIPRLFSSAHIEALVHGNCTPQIAKDHLQIVQDKLSTHCKARPLYRSQIVRDREVALPEGSNHCFQYVNETHSNSALELVLQTGVQETRENMLLELLCQILSEPAFDVLRTKESLGYIVFSGARRANGAQGLRVIVQGDKSPIYVEARIERFLYNMKKEIEDMPSDKFEEHRAALLAKRLEKPKKLKVLASRFWGEITSRQYNFNRALVEASDLIEIQKRDLIEYFDRLINVHSDSRKKLVVQVYSLDADKAKEVASGDAELKNTIDEIKCGRDKICCQIEKPEIISDTHEFKCCLPLLPQAKPFVKVPLPGLPDQAKL